ncbi:MAG TPA: biotin--[acetyl-CoA-carboxylase] ligase, partial [Burkholderiaceae bacterium]|nr:biotin--[acetyl-CoA-carboxylase] ligase [Burkholderiaceae bacterium]
MNASKAVPGDTTHAATQTPPALSVQALARHLHDNSIDLEVVASTGSTNADLIARARQMAPRRIVLRAASAQTAGRGRLGRIWHGSANGSVLFSIAVPWRGSPATTAAVTLACGLGVVECLHAYEVPVQLKWPNDILLDGRKLAGMLTETAEDSSGNRTLVIGMGLNLAVEPTQQLAVGQPVAELAERFGRASVCAQREQWLGRVARAMIDATRQFEAHGFAGMRERFNACLAFFGQTVDLCAPGQVAQRGTVRGVDDQGRLLLECEGTVRA